MPYRIDLHTHTWFSGDGVSSPEAMIAAAKRRGLHGIAITDHNTCDACHYLRDKGLLREDGQAVENFLIIPGVEVSTGDGHLLCLGTYMPDMKGAPAVDVARVCHDRGGIVIPPHPYDLFRAGIREEILDILPMDALEVFNAASSLHRYNDQAHAYADRRKLPTTAGSDAHHEDAVGTAFTELDAPELTVSAILQQVKRGGNLTERYLTTRDKIRKTLNNWFRLRRKPTYIPTGKSGG